MDPSLWWHRNVTGDVHVAFTSVRAGNLARHAGDQSAVEADRRRLELALGVPEPGFRYLHQTHSATVLDAHRLDADTGHPDTGHPDTGHPEPPEGDAWVSARGEEALAVLVADCLPVALVGRGDGPSADPVTAVAHAGRPGLIAGILERTVERMRAAGAREISAWIGPGACGHCYEVPQEMADRLAVGRPALRSTTRWGTPALDLRAHAVAVLTAEGVGVAGPEGCTIEDESLFSHRRDPGRGRIAVLVWRSRARR